MNNSYASDDKLGELRTEFYKLNIYDKYIKDYEHPITPRTFYIYTFLNNNYYNCKNNANFSELIDLLIEFAIKEQKLFNHKQITADQISENLKIIALELGTNEENCQFACQEAIRVIKSLNSSSGSETSFAMTHLNGGKRKTHKRKHRKRVHKKSHKKSHKKRRTYK
jgi:hypothetical protein